MSDLPARCEGRWFGILSNLGIPAVHLKNVHGPCPFCNGKDRYRWDNKDNKGRWICSQCGAGDGFDLLQKYHGWTFAQAAKEVESIVGTVKPVELPPEMTDDHRRSMLRQVWRNTSPMSMATLDPAWSYLLNRLEGRIPKGPFKDLRQGKVSVRWRRSEGKPLDDGETCMVAVVRDPCGDPCTMHRTYIQNGKKANMPNPKILMPGSYPEGSAIRLMPYTDELGIAEGIETAFAASLHFNMPVWSTINAHNMDRFIAPSQVKHLHIFADNDDSFTGHAAAYACAKRNRCGPQKTRCSVWLPKNVGADWLDQVLEVPLES